MKKISFICSVLLSVSGLSLAAQTPSLNGSNSTALELTEQQRMSLAQDFANKQDWKSVFDIIQPLALEGNVLAQGNLGMLYNLGRGVPKDQEKAYWWFSEAAEHGSIRAINNLAVMYYNGGYVKKTSRKQSNYSKPAPKRKI